MSEKPAKKRRRAVIMSDADLQLAAAGEAVAWDAVSVRHISVEPEKKPQLSPRDQQLANEVPPHW